MATPPPGTFQGSNPSLALPEWAGGFFSPWRHLGNSRSAPVVKPERVQVPRSPLRAGGKVTRCPRPQCPTRRLSRWPPTMYCQGPAVLGQSLRARGHRRLVGHCSRLRCPPRSGKTHTHTRFCCPWKLLRPWSASLDRRTWGARTLAEGLAAAIRGRGSAFRTVTRHATVQSSSRPQIYIRVTHSVGGVGTS